MNNYINTLQLNVTTVYSCKESSFWFWEPWQDDGKPILCRGATALIKGHFVFWNREVVFKMWTELLVMWNQNPLMFTVRHWIQHKCICRCSDLLLYNEAVLWAKKMSSLREALCILWFIYALIWTTGLCRKANHMQGRAMCPFSDVSVLWFSIAFSNVGNHSSLHRRL